jgi:hypothetical protein
LLFLVVGKKRGAKGPQGEGPIKKKTALRDVVNFYPMIVNELSSMGYQSLEDLQKLGWESLCRKYAKTFPERLNANMFLLLAASMQSLPKRRASEEMKIKAHKLVEKIKADQTPFRSRKPKKEKR